LVLAICAACVLPTQAPAWTVNLKGPGKGGGFVGLTLDDRVRAVQARISWSAPCGRGKFTTRTRIDFRTELLKPGKVAVRGRYRGRGPGYRYLVRLRFRGSEVKRFDVAAERPQEIWKGRFRAKVVVRRGGRVLTKCRSRTLRWTADGAPKFPEDENSTASIDLDSDPGHYVGQGETHSFDDPPEIIHGDGSRRHLEFSAGSWSITLEPPGSGVLVPGTFVVNRPPGASGDYGTVSVNAEGRGCSRDSGTFTVQSISFDPWGDVTSVSVTFEHRCEQRPEVLRGAVTYNRGY
jgi:hypothetical protein